MGGMSGGCLCGAVLDLFEEAPRDAKKGPGCLDVARMSRVGNRVHLGVRNRCGEFVGDRRELRVEFTDDEAYGDTNAAECFVERRLGAGSHAAQRVRQTVGPIAEPLRPGTGQCVGADAVSR